MKKITLIVLLYSVPGKIFCQQCDTLATEETKRLYENLKLLSKNHILFGHQHATAYGHGWNGNDSNNRSDVKSVTEANGVK